MIRRLITRLFRDDQGQDLTEYTLLIAMVSLVAFGLLFSTGNTAANVWNGAGNTLSTAADAASGATTAPPADHGDHDDH